MRPKSSVAATSAPMSATLIAATSGRRSYPGSAFPFQTKMNELRADTCALARPPGVPRGTSRSSDDEHAPRRRAEGKVSEMGCQASVDNRPGSRDTMAT